MKWLNGIALVVLGIFTTSAFADKPLALIYKGTGSCEAEATTTGCSEAVQAVAEMAGFDTAFVGPNDASNPLFKTAKVWIQPGGEARKQAAAMPASLRNAIVAFVNQGGGYVGFCAGGFMATEKFGWDTITGPFEANGLGFFPGKSFYYDLFDPELSDTLQAKVIPVQWLGQMHMLYWELGPYFQPLSVTPSTQVTAYYNQLNSPNIDSGRILSMRETFGHGRVFVSAVHPEAPQDWRDFYKLSDSDGLDFPLAVDMIQWAAGLKN